LGIADVVAGVPAKNTVGVLVLDESVGVSVLLSEGALLGWFDGLILGCPEGSMDGVSLGSSEGATDGASLDSFEGVWVEDGQF
jgi:hypothetical protein